MDEGACGAENYISPKDLKSFQADGQCRGSPDIILDYERRVGPPLVVPEGVCIKRPQNSEVRIQNLE